MGFKDWCRDQYGIDEFSTGKIDPWYVLPPQAHRGILPGSTPTHYGAVDAQPPYKGLLISKAGFQRMMGAYRAQYQVQYPPTYPGQQINEPYFQSWVDTQLQGQGIMLSHRTNYRYSPPVYITFTDKHKQANFMRDYQACRPVEDINPLTGQPAVKVYGRAMSRLLDNYSHSPQHNTKAGKDDGFLKAQRQALAECKADIKQFSLEKRLDSACHLARDQGNDSRIAMKFYNASSAYGMSLRIYAELNRDVLSPIKYQQLKYAASMLASYDSHQQLRQGLKTDANFTDFIRDSYRSQAKKIGGHAGGPKPLIAQLPHGSSLLLDIETNARNLLHGHPSVPLGGGKTFRMKRFLPDPHNQMKSETDEIVLQGGGATTHSAVYRIIKVGFKADGTQARPDEEAHHYNYYKVENNLGLGCKEIKWDERTCASPYVTQIMPCEQGLDGEPTRCPIDPRRDPKAYHQAMEYTLGELIQSERQAMCYRQAATGPNQESAAPPGSAESIEWSRLNRNIATLSGDPSKEQLHYYTPSEDDPSKYWQCSVQTARGYMQEDGSCTIFSLNSLIDSVLGTDLASLHREFLQTHGADAHLRVIDDAVKTIDTELSKRAVSKSKQEVGKPSMAAAAATFGFHALPDHPPSEGHILLQKSTLPRVDLIKAVSMAPDLGDPSLCVVKLKCHSEGQARGLAKEIEKLTTSNPPLKITAENELIIGDKRQDVLFSKIGIDKASLYQALQAPSDSAHP